MDDRPVFDKAAGAFRLLGHPELPAAAKPIVAEWFDKRIAYRGHTTTRVRGRKHPKVVTETEEFELTAGVVLGGVGLLLAWEAGQAIAHGLAGLNPSTWLTDVEDWITGNPQPGNVVDNSLGGWIQGHVMAVLSPPAAPASTSSGIPHLPGGTGIGGTPPVSFPFPLEPIV